MDVFGNGAARLSLIACTALALGLAVAGCSKQAHSHPATPALQFDQVSTDPVANGKRLVTLLDCTGCHNPQLSGNDFSQPGLGTFWSANISRAAPDMSDAQLKAAIAHGMGPHRALWGMPSFGFTPLSDTDLASIIAYIRTVPATGDVHPEPDFGPAIKQAIADGKFETSAADAKTKGVTLPADAGPDYALGRYLVRTGCGHCHGPELRGGPEPLDPTFKPADLRIAAAYDDAAFKALLRTGVAAGGRELPYMSETARASLKLLTDHEIDQIHAYLKQLARIDP